MMAATRMPNGLALGVLLDGLTSGVVPAACVISGIALDSRKVQPGDLFLALGGSRSHGSRFIDDAIAHGAVAVAIDAHDAIADSAILTVPLVTVNNLRINAGVIADRFYAQPSAAMWVIGVTGTNGKTSVSQFIAQVLNEDAPCAVIGTLGSGLFGVLCSTGHTTPDVISMHAQLAAQCAAGARYVAMEVSSHGLDQQRVSGVAFDVAVFTNLSHEHLDYHGDMSSYALAKRRLLQQPGLCHAVLNLDDEVGARWFAEHAEQAVHFVGYGFDVATTTGGDIVRGSNLQLTPAGVAFDVSTPWGDGHIDSQLLGHFNASNLLAALGALLATGVTMETALQRLAGVNTVPGRMERFGTVQQPTVVVDYAHTPDALEKVLQALRAHCHGDLWCVFGCGGDRDRAKRPLMGQLAESLADRVVLTDDNPRSENPWDIIEDIQRGMKEPDAAYVMRDRGAAIAHAVGQAQAGDVVLVAGKGHETEQIVADRVLPFSDRAEVARLLGGRLDG